MEISPKHMRHFNSRTHVECDANSEDQSATSFISTHALTWSATRLWIRQRLGIRFQLTHSRGVRRRSLNWQHRTCRFQLTHSRGVRPRNSRARRHAVNFNSRTHVECDNFQIPQEPMPQISTHALTWSATIATAPPGAPKRDFNSRTHVECDVHHVFRFRCIH